MREWIVGGALIAPQPAGGHLKELELTHNTANEYRAIAKTDYHQGDTPGDCVSFDIYAGPDRSRGPADCQISVEGWLAGGKRTTHLSGSLTFEEMVALAEMLNSAVAIARSTMKASPVAACHAKAFDPEVPQNMCTRDAGHPGDHRCKAADVDARRDTGREAPL